MKQQLAYLSSCHNTHVTASVLLPLVCFPPSQHNLSPMACILLFSPSFRATIPGSSNGTKSLRACATMCRHFSTSQRVSFSLSFIYVQVLISLMNQFFSSCCSLGHQYCSSYSLKNWCPLVKNLPLPVQFFNLFFREPISHHLFTISFTILCSALRIRFLRFPRNNNWHTYLPTASPLFFSKLPTINFKPAKRIHHIQIHP